MYYNNLEKLYKSDIPTKKMECILWRDLPVTPDNLPFV